MRAAHSAHLLIDFLTLTTTTFIRCKLSQHSNLNRNIRESLVVRGSAEQSGTAFIPHTYF
jgi:hypothetical protein